MPKPVKRIVFAAMVAWGSVWKTSPELFTQDLCLLAAIFYWPRGVMRFNQLVFWISGRNDDRHGVKTMKEQDKARYPWNTNDPAWCIK